MADGMVMREKLFPTHLIGTASERLLAGRLAGLLYVLAGASVLALPLLPGGASDHLPLAARLRLRGGEHGALPPGAERGELAPAAAPAR